MRMASKIYLLGTLMVLSVGLTKLMTPTIYLSERHPKLFLEKIIPVHFGDWVEDRNYISSITNPETEAALKNIYSQTLSRSYVNTNGAVIMLSIAYGANQSDKMAMHYPEVCYPAQGFQLLSNKKFMLKTKFGALSVKHLVTRLGNRSEPITYWSTLGGEVVYGGLETKLAQLQHGFRGVIPDGLIFRVSSIDPDIQRAFIIHESFINAILIAMSPPIRKNFSGN